MRSLIIWIYINLNKTVWIVYSQSTDQCRIIFIFCITQTQGDTFTQWAVSGNKQFSSYNKSAVDEFEII